METAILVLGTTGPRELAEQVDHDVYTGRLHGHRSILDCFYTLGVRFGGSSYHKSLTIWDLYSGLFIIGNSHFCAVLRTWILYRDRSMRALMEFLSIQYGPTFFRSQLAV